MSASRALVLVLTALLLAGCRQSRPLPSTTSPYVHDQARPIKALSPEQLQGLLDGAGLGYARAAELNGYPGPRHVLDLAEALGLSPEQQRRTEATFEAMQTEAQALGRALVAVETQLDHLFAAGRADAPAVRHLTGEAARLEGALRHTHLAAHLHTAAVLTPGQIQAYQQLRGYTVPSSEGGQEHHHPTGHDR